MGMPVAEMKGLVEGALGDEAMCKNGHRVGLVAPLSSGELDEWRYRSKSTLMWQEAWRYRQHLNMDDLDFGGPKGWVAELQRVVGRRGLGVWTVGRRC